MRRPVHQQGRVMCSLCPQPHRAEDAGKASVQRGHVGSPLCTTDNARDTWINSAGSTPGLTSPSLLLSTPHASLNLPYILYLDLPSPFSTSKLSNTIKLLISTWKCLSGWSTVLWSHLLCHTLRLFHKTQALFPSGKRVPETVLPHFPGRNVLLS